MNRLWICLLLIAIAFGASKAQNDENAFPDYWADDYDDQWYNDELEKLKNYDEEEIKEPVEDNNQDEIVKDASVDTADKFDDTVNKPDLTDVGEQEKIENEIDMKVEDEIKQFRGDLDAKPIDKDTFDAVNDYQFEDNRSEVKDEEDNFQDIEDEIVKDERLDNDSESRDSESVEPIGDDNKVDDDLFIDEAVEKVEDTFNLNKNENVELPSFDDKSNKEIFDETRDILNEDNTNDFAEDVQLKKSLDEVDNDKIDQSPLDNENDKSIFEETQKILNEDNGNNEFAEETPVKVDEQPDIEEVIDETRRILEETKDDFDEGNNENSKQKSTEDIDPSLKDDKDTVDKVYADLNADLDKLFETWDKLNNDDIEENNEDNVEEVINADYVAEYEDKYQRPFKEKIVLQQRDDYENIDDSHLSEIFEDNKSDENPIAVDYKVLSGNDNDDIPNEDTDLEENIDKELNDASQELDEKPVAIPYVDDALVDNEDEKQNLEDNADIPNVQKVINEEDSVKAEINNVQEATPDFLASDARQPRQLEGCPDDSPIHVTLKINEPVVITSCNYPNAYPTNSVVDWIFEGEGVGIEFNISDLAVNTMLGDYLLVIPGAINENSTNGLIFSYRLDEERRYRFLDVSRMFVRFKSESTMMFMRGFKFSVNMIAERPPELDDDSEPEPVIPIPMETFTVHLGGITHAQFQNIKEQFRQLLADMATLYINVNQINPGLMNTSQVTQIVNTTICNMYWPNFENCTAIRFAVPLMYDGDDDDEPRLDGNDLSTMWNTYIHQDPFALRLHIMGIKEFLSPNDGGVLMAWLVIAAGVVISMVMLGFALWRFSCFEEYTRMPTFNDTDSLHNEKRDLDLYPTPHQTLPPLYSESEYQWTDEQPDGSAVRVDIGGFANKSYEQDELYTLESDEDVIPTRDRDNNITPKEVYQAKPDVL